MYSQSRRCCDWRALHTALTTTCQMCYSTPCKTALESLSSRSSMCRGKLRDWLLFLEHRKLQQHWWDDRRRKWLWAFQPRWPPPAWTDSSLFWLFSVANTLSSSVQLQPNEILKDLKTHRFTHTDEPDFSYSRTDQCWSMNSTWPYSKLQSITSCTSQVLHQLRQIKCKVRQV